MVSLQASVVQNKEITREFTPKIIYNKKKKKKGLKLIVGNFVDRLNKEQNDFQIRY